MRKNILKIFRCVVGAILTFSFCISAKTRKEHYVYKEMGIEFDYPATWMVQKSPVVNKDYNDLPEISIMLLTTPKSGMRRVEGMININVSRARGLSLERLLEKDEKKVLEGIKEEHKRRVVLKDKVGGKKSIERQLSLKVEGKWSNPWSTVLVKNGDVLYNIFAANMDVEKSEFAEVLNIILKSMKFIGKPVAKAEVPLVKKQDYREFFGEYKSIIPYMKFYCMKNNWCLAVAYKRLSGPKVAKIENPAFFWKDSEKFRQLFLKGGVYTGSNGWEKISFGELSHKGSMKLRSSSVSLECPNKNYELLEVVDDASIKKMKEATFYLLPVIRDVIGLTQIGKSANYIYIDHSPNPEDSDDTHRVFIGQKGALKRIKLLNFSMLLDGGTRFYNIKDATIELNANGKQNIKYKGKKAIPLVGIEDVPKKKEVLGPELQHLINEMRLPNPCDYYK